MEMESSKTLEISRLDGAAIMVPEPLGPISMEMEKQICFVMTNKDLTGQNYQMVTASSRKTLVNTRQNGVQ
jgi:hypothetical protein